MDHFQLRNGELYCEDVPLAEIAASVGTPVYVYSTATMRRHVAALRSALEPLADPLIAYAVKANPNSAVIATLARAGLGADVVSGGEYARATAAGVPGDKIVFSGVGKTEAEMRLALEGGLYQFNLESLAEAEMLSAVASAMGRTAPVGFRVNPDVAAGGHAKISTGAAENKFGIAISDAIEAYARAAALPGLAVQGVAIHIGSQLTSLDPLERAFTHVGELIAELRAAG
ncbi:MAG: diaminopimelate decarboxylase, partial [Sphingomonadales bacterium]|nr:diaminopimelate decarboxylase [Sphingomonadales bacterium]